MRTINYGWQLKLSLQSAINSAIIKLERLASELMIKGKIGNVSSIIIFYILSIDILLSASRESPSREHGGGGRVFQYTQLLLLQQQRTCRYLTFILYIAAATSVYTALLLQRQKKLLDN